MGARHYSPSLGRFLQPDPPALEANLYAYAANSPVTKADPSGEFAIAIPFLAPLAAGAASALAKAVVAVGAAVGAAVVGSTIGRALTRTRGCWVIGEDQTRVIAFATLMKPRCAVMWTLNGYGHKTKVAINVVWAYSQMAQGKHLYDLGPLSQSLRSIKSDYYRAEWAVTYLYPFKTRLWGWRPPSR
jgi:hypothetical protein